MRAQLVTLLILFTLLLLLTLGSADARAQGARGYVGGGGLFSTQTSHRPGESPSLPRTGADGSSFGGVGEAGWFIMPAVSVSGEMSLPVRFTSVQETDYFQSFRTENRYRDLIVSALAHVQTPAAGRARFEVTAGPSLVQESSIQRRSESPAPFGSLPVFGPYGAEAETTHIRFGVTIGAGLAVAVSSHLSIVPEMRAHWIQRSASSYNSATDSFDNLWYLGLSPWVYRPAISVRALF